MSSDGKPESRWFRLVYLLVVIGRKNLPYFLNQSVARFYCNLVLREVSSTQFRNILFQLVSYSGYCFIFEGKVECLQPNWLFVKSHLHVISEICPPYVLLWGVVPVIFFSIPKSIVGLKATVGWSVFLFEESQMPLKKKTSIIRWNDNKYVCKTNRNKPWRREL